MKNFRLFVYGYVEDHDDGEDSDDVYRWRGTSEFVMTSMIIDPIDKPTENNHFGYDRTFDFSVADDVKTVYVVYARYSTGDTFGRDDGQIVVMDVFSEYFQAEYLQALLRDEQGFSLKWEERDYYIPWNGYFEHLDNIDIETIRLPV